MRTTRDVQEWLNAIKREEVKIEIIWRIWFAPKMHAKFWQREVESDRHKDHLAYFTDSFDFDVCRELELIATSISIMQVECVG